jgi:hypothetical protein
MKQSPELKKAQGNMRPGVIIVPGFLGSDRRDLAQILEEDDMAVRRLGLTHGGIAAKMRALRDAGIAGLGEFVDVAPHFRVRVDDVRGRLRCPFEDPGLVSKTNTTVENLCLGRQITYTDLGIHLIEVHGFYQGRGSAFRVEPGDLADILEFPVSGL